MSTELSNGDKEFIKDTSVFIENTNRECMEMIKEGILRAINSLPQYQSEKLSGPYYLKEEDVLAAIEDGYKGQVEAYEALRKKTIAGITGDKPEDDEKKITELHEIMKSEIGKMSANEMRVFGELDGGGGKGGMYRPKKNKKSRKHPK